jgi:hypothetical protein
MGPFASGIDAAAWTLIGVRNAIRHIKPRKTLIIRNISVRFIKNLLSTQEMIDLLKKISYRGITHGEAASSIP